MNQYTHVTHKLNETVFGTRPYLPECFFKDFTFSMRTDTHGFGIVSDYSVLCIETWYIERVRGGGEGLFMGASINGTYSDERDIRK